MGSTRKAGRAAALLTGVAGMTIGTASMAGADIITIDAPTSESSGVAVEVPGVIAVGKTSATADSSTGAASGFAVQLGDATPPEQLGGTQTGPGTTSGALLDTGATPLGQVQVTPWGATVTASSTQRTADSSAALARVDVLDPSMASLDVLQSTSHAEHSGGTSAGSSSSDGAVLTLGDSLTLRLLHAEASSGASGHSYLIGINDTQLVASGDANGSCVVTVPSLLTLVCLDASGGVGKSAAEVLRLVVGGDGGLGADVVGASSSGGTAATQVLPSTLVPTPSVGDAARAGRAGSLASTGADVWFTLTLGAAVLSLGGAITMLGRLRTAAA